MTDFEKLQLVKQILQDTKTDDDYGTYDRGIDDALMVINFDGEKTEQEEISKEA